jgi:hypothetical protein
VPIFTGRVQQTVSANDRKRVHGTCCESSNPSRARRAVNKGQASRLRINSNIVRARKEPPEKGGWNLLHTWWLAADVINPAVHFGVSGAGPRAWFGWPDIPQLEKLVTDWVRVTDQTKRKQLADEVQKVALGEVTYVPWGEWVQPTAFRKNVRDDRCPIHRCHIESA